MKILIIDDHVLFREGLISLVSHQPDMSVVGEGGSVSEAIALSRTLHPNMILMDFSLPDGTGLDAAEVILREQPDMRIIFLTIHDDDERLFSAIRLGAKGFLMKNIPVVRLLAALRGVQRGEAALSREMTARLMDAFAQLNPPTNTHPSTPFNELTAREVEVLRELATDATNHEIADRLFISENTVRNHVHNILEKLGISNRREAVSLAHQHGLGGISPTKNSPQ
jgi:DNA-binding NarL/FixJ family response regulator